VSTGTVILCSPVLGYFNSLRELDRSRRIVEDEVNTRLKSYGLRHRADEEEGVFVFIHPTNPPASQRHPFVPVADYHRTESKYSDCYADSTLAPPADYPH
jgi:hypothetical protein